MKKIILIITLFSVFNSFAISLPKNLKLETMDGEKQELANKRQLVYFWATWCKSCLPKLQKTLPKLKTEKNIPVVTVNMDQHIKKALKYTSKKGVDLPIFRDSGGIFENQLSVKTLPHWAIIENTKNGWKLISHETGFNQEKIINVFNQKTIKE